jgi:hypothetical protein
MQSNSDWLPGRRADQLAMADNWIIYLTSARRTVWGVPQDQFTALSNLYDAAKELLRQAMDEDERTHVITVRCQKAFKDLVEKLRFFKDRYFKVPPLDEGDIAALGLKKRDPSSPIPAPEGQAEADITFPGIHLLELKNIRPVGTSGLPDPRSDYGARIYYGFSGPASQKFPFRVTGVPKTGTDLPYSIFTRRKKERFDFDGESGNTVYFCLRYENPKGQAGPFGPIMSAVVP